MYIKGAVISFVMIIIMIITIVDLVVLVRSWWLVVASTLSVGSISRPPKKPIEFEYW